MRDGCRICKVLCRYRLKTVLGVFPLKCWASMVGVIVVSLGIAANSVVVVIVGLSILWTNALVDSMAWHQPYLLQCFAVVASNACWCVLRTLEVF